MENARIDALISIGGDDTAYYASRVARYAREAMGVDLRSAGVPKTIDNDLPLPGDIPTFGYETARDVVDILVTTMLMRLTEGRPYGVAVLMAAQFQMSSSVLSVYLANWLKPSRFVRKIHLLISISLTNTMWLVIWY